MTLLTIWLTFMQTLAPHEPPSRLSDVAREVIQVTPDVDEQSLLLTIDFYERTWGRSGIPYGTSSLPRTVQEDPTCHEPRHAPRGARRRCRRVPVVYTSLDRARYALGIIRRGARMCRGRIPHILGNYHHGGGCVSDIYSENESRMVLRMRNWFLNPNHQRVPQSRFARNQ